MTIIPAHLPVSKFYARGKNKVRRIVLHWNAAERSGEDFCKRIRNHVYNYDYFIDYEGNIYQFNPNYSKYAAKHTGGNNMWTLGICLMSPGYYPTKPKYDWEPVAETIHGRAAVHTRFTAAQIDSCFALCKRALETLALDPAVCTEATILPKKELDKYTITGHFHHSRNKRDPGMHLMHELQTRFDDRLCEQKESV